MKPIISIFLIILYFFILFVVYYLHITFFQIDIVFYAAIADGLIAAGIVSILFLINSVFQSFSYFEKALLITILTLSGYIFAISVPTVIDRSLSIYILEKLQQRGGGIRYESIAKVFTDEYLHEHRLVEVRLTEQIKSGTIVITNDCVKLTSKGETIASFGRYFRKNWLPKERLLMNVYTDALTDPFRGGVDNKNYLCK